MLKVVAKKSAAPLIMLEFNELCLPIIDGMIYQAWTRYNNEAEAEQAVRRLGAIVYTSDKLQSACACRAAGA